MRPFSSVGKGRMKKGAFSGSTSFAAAAAVVVGVFMGINVVAAQAQTGGFLSSSSSPEDDALTSPSISSASTSSSAIALVITKGTVKKKEVEDILLESNSILHEHDEEEKEDEEEEEDTEYVEEELSSLSLPTDAIFGELLYSRDNGTDKGLFTTTVEDFQRDKRGAIQLGRMMKCATGCNPLSYKGYGCYCGFLGSGVPVDGIDKCCKMHDWCYTTTTCMGLQYDLPYFVGFKWKCNGGAPYCIPGKSHLTGRDSCPHQLCECDREFAMCLKHFACPKSKAACMDSGPRFIQNLVMALGAPRGMHNPHSHHGSHHRGRHHQTKHKYHHGYPPPLRSHHHGNEIRTHKKRPYRFRIKLG